MLISPYLQLMPSGFSVPLSNPRSVVEAFVDAWTRMDFHAVMGCLAPDIYYHNIPLTPIAGKTAVESYLREAWTFSACEWKLLSIAVNGNQVLTERIDAFTINSRSVVLPVMGVFEVRDSQITQWRDYFDLASYRAQLERAAEGTSHGDKENK